MIATIDSCHQNELVMDGVSEECAMISVFELDRVPETFFVGVGEEELPGVAAVGGFVEAGEVAFAAGHNDGGVLVEGLDASEVEILGSWGDGAGMPEVAAVLGADDGAVGATGPDCSSTGVGDAAQVGGGRRVFEIPLGVGGR